MTNKPKEQVCEFCNKRYLRTSNGQKFCCKSCKWKFYSSTGKRGIYNYKYEKNNSRIIKRWKKKHPEKVKEYMRDYKRRNKEKLKTISKTLVGRVQQYTNGNFKKSKKCNICNSTKKLSFHHWKYRLPVQRKDFSTLCDKCHKAQHRRISKYERML